MNDKLIRQLQEIELSKRTSRLLESLRATLTQDLDMFISPYRYPYPERGGKRQIFPTGTEVRVCTSGVDDSKYIEASLNGEVYVSKRFKPGDETKYVYIGEQPNTIDTLCDRVFGTDGWEGTEDETFELVAAARGAGFSDKAIRSWLSDFFGAATEENLDWWLGDEGPSDHL